MNTLKEKRITTGNQINKRAKIKQPTRQKSKRKKQKQIHAFRLVTTLWNGFLPSTLNCPNRVSASFEKQKRHIFGSTISKNVLKV